MSEEEKKQEEQQSAESQDSGEALKKEVDKAEPSSDPVAEPEEKQPAAIDEDGVPYKNRAAEYQRKMEKIEAELQLLRNQQHNPPVYNYPPNAAPQEPQKKDPKAALNEFVEKGPDEWYAERRAAEVRQEKMNQAENMIRKAFPNENLAFAVNKVLNYAKQNAIDVVTDPVRGVKVIIDQLSAAAKKKEVKEETVKSEKKRVEKINKTKTEAGTKPPAPPANKSKEKLERLKKRGSIDDVADYLTDIL